MDAYHIHKESMRPNTNLPYIDFIYKPIMIYYFVDPFCHHCWNLETYFKKLTMEYGTYFNMRPIIGPMYNEAPNRLLDKHHHQIVCNYDHLNKYHGALGIKAAALQGNKSGRDFLRNVQEAIFLYNKIESLDDILMHAAEKANIDMNEFKNDLESIAAKKAYESDIQFKHEMDINQYPTILFFSQYIEDYSVKVSGFQSYETYTFVLKKMLHRETIEITKPTIEACLHKYRRVQTEEIAFIFDLTFKEAEKRLKQLQLMQKVKQVIINDNSFWEYCGSSD